MPLTAASVAAQDLNRGRDNRGRRVPCRSPDNADAPRWNYRPLPAESDRSRLSISVSQAPWQYRDDYPDCRYLQAVPLRLFPCGRSARRPRQRRPGEVKCGRPPDVLSGLAHPAAATGGALSALSMSAGLPPRREDLLPGRAVCPADGRVDAPLGACGSSFRDICLVLRSVPLLHMGRSDR